MLLSRPLSISNVAPSVDYTVMVGVGKVSADLTDFPLMIDLSNMPPSFWSQVNSTGGNIRAYAPNGVTVIPHDVTYVNKTRSIGRMFVKKTLLTASNNVVIIKLLGMGTAALDATDPNGRNAMWSDYEVVWVFPDTANRTGKAYTQSMSSMLTFSEWKRVNYTSLTGAPHNGISTDGTHFISTDDIVLRRMNMSYVVQQTVANINTALSAMTGLSNFDHMGDPVCVGTSTFFTVTTSDSTYRRFLVEYRTSDLTLLNAWEMTGAQRIFGATVCYDGVNLIIFSFEDDTKFIKYTTSGTYVGDVSITGRPIAMNDYQGSTVMPNGNIYVSGGSDGVFEITPSGAYVQKAYTDPHASIMEGLDYRNGNLWLLKGDGNMITLRNDIATDFGYWHQNDEAYATLPNSQIWTMGGTSYQVRSDFQYSYIALDDPSTTSNTTGTAITYDEGPDDMGTWNSTDLWLYTTPTLTPVAYDTMRMALGYNGTAERKIRLRRGATSYNGVDVGVSARPTGVNMDFLINTGERSVNQDGATCYQFVWLRTQYLSDAWIDADQENMTTPSTFYSIT